ncbi:MAG TPA: PEP-CTERM sorting domain-containing protein [Steroidobacteraceae bacterium]|nr:PEP-CTERM sorting domain-containing protein [Steroidobacteraceae bacterium]
MRQPTVRVLLCTLAVVAATSAAFSAQAQVLILDVPQLASHSGVKDFQFLSFNFNVYPTSPSGACGDSDFCENIVANLTETYNYLYTPGCSGSGRGAPPCTPPHPYIATATTPTSAADTYKTITSPPSGLDVRFHFLGTDVASIPLAFEVADRGSPNYILMDDTTGTLVAPGTPLSAGPYTLEYLTNSLAGSTVTVTAVPEPGACALMAAGLGVLGFAAGRPKKHGT